MIQFNELRITQDGTQVIIEVEVLGDLKYEKVFLDKIVIDNEDTYKEGGPSTTPIYEFRIQDTIKTKHYRLILDQELLPKVIINKTLFFIYVGIKGTFSEDMPEADKTPISLGVTANMYPFYQNSIYFYKNNLGDDCKDTKQFINYILQYRALLFSIKTGNYIESIFMWKKYFKNPKPGLIPFNNCSCHGSAK